ncbi:hypothetical protein AYO44_12405 [Planctomycetaceae bacterium SCGC AG-212-F19]|nr:hypothetical protein AYO44_12405 [Planctomycetaceae bacterium SCGC AG-212-F19]
MPTQSFIVSPGPFDGSLRSATGEILHPPAEWVLLPPGDATLTRRVKAAGPTWTVQVKRGRKTFSQGVWAPAVIVEQVRVELAAERSTPQYAKKRAAATRRREHQQGNYIDDFHGAVLAFLAFDPVHADLAERLARAVTAHATPVGSGTVARTQRIPVEQRAEAAVIAWLRHQTTAYDGMKIPRVRGKRRAVRRLLAEQSRQLLSAYRRGVAIEAAVCPLDQALRAVPNGIDGRETNEACM